MVNPIFCASSIVIFGGTGDLATRKLIPALCRLQEAGLLIDDFHIFATGRKDKTTEEFIAEFEKAQATQLQKDAALKSGFNALIGKFRYLRADPGRANEAESFFSRLQQAEPAAAPARLFYLAVPPKNMEDFISLIRPFSAHRQDQNCLERILVEKPFGYDLASAKELNSALLKDFREEQILRIDHYLGKEAVQNLLFMRFANLFFEPVWNNHYISNVQISFAEKMGIGNRASYFDQTGILRDVVQNHLLQVLCMIAMEPPLSIRPSDLHLEKSKVLKAVCKLKPEEIATDTVRAQYLGNSSDEEKIVSYHEEKDVGSSSTTETFAACRLFINNWRWKGVPFYLRAGKRLKRNLTEICINFKPVLHNIFPMFGRSLEPNRLFIRIQPDEGINLQLNSKPPGMKFDVTNVGMNFSYETEFGSYRPDAYERLLLDALKGDSALFLTSGEIEESWKIIDPIIEGWKSQNAPVAKYEAGSHGPAEACKLLEKHGHAWCYSGAEKQCK